MSGGIRLRAMWVVAALLPALVAVEPVVASAAPAPDSGVPELAFPDVETALPARPTAGDGTLSVPADAGAALPAASQRSKSELPEADHELVAERDATTEVWENVDGSQTVTIHGEPIHYQPAGSTVWEEIDNTLIPDPTRPGWVRNAENDWTARFGPVRPGGQGGVEVVTDSGPVRFAPKLPAGHAPVTPVVGTGDDANTVTYPEVWPGVDVRYEVTGGRVKEDIVVSDDTQAAFPFVTEGLALVESTVADDTSSVDVTGAQHDDLALLAPEVIAADGGPAGDEAAPSFDVTAPAAADGVANTTVPGAPQVLTVSVDDEWLGDEVADGDAVVVDPTIVSLTGFWHTAYKSDGYSCTGCGVKVGNSQGGSGGAPTYWHTNGGFAYWSSIVGKQVLYAGVWISKDTNSQSSAGQPVSLYWATGDSYNDAVANGDPNRVLGTQTVGDSAAFDVTSTVGAWQYFGLQNEGFGFSGAETTCTQATTACYTYRSFTAALVMNVNSAPGAPALVAPGDGSLAVTSTTPTLKWGTVTDADTSDTVKYTAKIATGADGTSGMVATSPEGTATSWQVPAGVLRDGVTYYWAVWANDGYAWTKSAVRTLTVNRNGIAAPNDDFAGVATNLVTGASSVRVPGVTLPTVGGDVAVNYVYESMAPTGGLQGTYRADDGDHVIESSDAVVLVRDDPQLSFNWAGAAGTGEAESQSPSPGVPANDFSVTWKGKIAVPSTGTWKLGARSDDGVRIYLDGSATPVVDSWATGPLPATPVYQSGTASGGVHDIKVEYFQATGASALELWAKDTAATPATELVVPAGWLSGGPRVLPAGWRIDASVGGAEYQRAEVTEGGVTLFRPDGTALSFPKMAYGLSYAPPKGVEDVVVVNADGTVTVQADSGITYLFNADGSLKGSEAATDEAASSPAVVPAYDSSGRLTTLTDPVSQQHVDLYYAPDTACDVGRPSPAGVGSLPTGMLCRVKYWDGTSTYLFYNNGLLAYVWNPGNAAWGLSYATDGKLAGYHDPLAYDAAMSGARTDWDKLLVELAYDTSGRTATVTQQPPLQGGLRPARTYGYAPTVNGNGELTGGTATVTRAGVSGTYRSVAYDARARATSETDAVGLVTTTTWNGDDEATRTDEPGGLRTTTLYDQESQPTHAYGPAPAAQFNADGTGQAGVAHETTNYDQGINGLAVAWWPNATFTGLPTVHQHDADTLDSDWGTGSPASGIPADNFTGRYTGELVFPTAGTYALRFVRDNKLALYLDDWIRLYDWPNTTAGTSAEAAFTTATAGESHRLRIDFGETTGSAKLTMQWKVPGSSTWVTVPASALHTGYGLVTSSVGVDNTTNTTQYADSASALGIVHGVPTSSTTDPSGLALTSTTRYETAGYRRPIALIMPSGDERTMTYYGGTETRDNPCTTAADAAIQAARKKLDSATDPDGTGSETAIVQETVYDATGRPVAARVGSEPWVCTTYDARGRVTKIEYPAFGGAAARTVTYTYAVDPDGAGPLVTSPLVTSISDAAGTITAEADLAGHLVAQTDVFGNTTTFTYDQAGRQTSSSGPVGTIATTYDGADRVTQLQRNSQVLANGFVYDTAGRMTNVAYPSGTGNAGNGTAGTFGYDSIGRPSSTTWTGPSSTTITSDSVTRDVAGRVAGEIVDGTDHHSGDDFAYDTSGRLIDAWVPGGRYQYLYYQNGYCTAPDNFKNGNRTGVTITPTGGTAASTFYCYDHADRLYGATDAAVGTVAYDAHGNSTSMFGETHTYDAANRHLTTTKSGTTVTYVRDAVDRIVERRVGSTVVARYGYTASGDAPSFVTDGAGTVLSVTFSLPGGALLSTGSGGANTWSYPNLHGDVVATANQSGAKQGATTIYDPFGNLVSGPLPDNSPGSYDYGWLGRHERPLEHEATLQPVVEMGARQYSSLLGRFVEVDPILGGVDNDYVYPPDPVNNFDLTGTDTCSGKRSMHIVKNIASRRHGNVTLRCGTWDGHSGWGWRKIEGKHFQLNGFWNGGENNLKFLIDTLKHPDSVGKTRWDAQGRPSVRYKKTWRCFNGCAETMTVVINPNNKRVLTAWKN